MDEYKEARHSHNSRGSVIKRSASLKSEVHVFPAQPGTPLYGGSFVHSMSTTLPLAAEEFMDVPFQTRSMRPVNQQPILFQMSYQNAFASRTIQKHWRGYWARVQLWQWGGVMLTSRAIKIQRVWRGREGRKKALLWAKAKLANLANKIKGRFFIWHAQRKLRVLRAEAIEQRVIKIQCLYRTRLARVRVARARFLHRTRMAIRIEALVRGRFGRVRYRGIKARLRVVYERMTLAMRKDISQAVMRIKPTLQNLIDYTDLTDPWQLLESTLFHIIGTGRRDVAVDLASELLMKFNHFAYGRFALQVALFLTWTCSGATQHQRVDMLDELVGCLYYNQYVRDMEEDFNNASIGHETVRPESLQYPKVARFGWQDVHAGCMDELEFMYFRNGFLRHGYSGHAMSAMAACILMRLHVKDFSKERNKQQKSQIKRAYELLTKAALLNTNNVEESKFRIEITENIFMRAHRVLLRKSVSFNGLKMLGYKAYSLLHRTHQMSLKDSLTLDLEVCRCGELVIVRGTFSKFPLALDAISTLRKHNHIPSFEVETETGEARGVDMAPKWASYTIDYESHARTLLDSRITQALQIAKPVLHSNASMSLDAHMGDQVASPVYDQNAADPVIHQDSLTVTAAESPLSPKSQQMLESTPSVTSVHGEDKEIRVEQNGEEREHLEETEEDEEEAIDGPSPALELDPVLFVRPMVLTQQETLDMCEIAIKLTAAKQRISEEAVRVHGALNVLAEYLCTTVRVVTCRSRIATNVDGGQTTALRITLPQIEYRRLEQNNARTVDYSVKLIQRIYRGCRGKHRFHRIWFRSKERIRQLQILSDKRRALATTRDQRYLLISKIQACVKAWSWRRFMVRMKRAALKIQCRFRCFRAKNIVDEERRRRAMGPEVHEMLRKNVLLGDLEFIVVVYRCGFQYRLRGYNLVKNAIYEGNVFQEEVELLCREFNDKITGKTVADERRKISPWNYHKVTELMITLLGIAEATPVLTTNLGGIPESGGRKQYALIMRPYATAETPGLTKIKNLSRVLKDTAPVVEKFEKMLTKEARQRAQGLLSQSKGLVPDKPKRKKLKDLDSW